MARRDFGGDKVAHAALKVHFAGGEGEIHGSLLLYAFCAAPFGEAWCSRARFSNIDDGALWQRQERSASGKRARRRAWRGFLRFGYGGD